MILTALDAMPKDKTVVMISHRPSALTDTDVVYELKNYKLCRKNTLEKQEIKIDSIDVNSKRVAADMGNGTVQGTQGVKE